MSSRFSRLVNVCRHTIRMRAQREKWTKEEKKHGLKVQAIETASKLEQQAAPLSDDEFNHFIQKMSNKANKKP